MQVRDIMTEDPACCTDQTTIQDVAEMMLDCDCGEIPVVDKFGKPVGVITDRDIACRAVAKGSDPGNTNAGQIMSSPVITVTPDTDLEECCQQMEKYQLRRIPVIDSEGRCCGMVSQADIARNAPEHEAAQVLKDVSRPAPSSPQAWPA